MKQRTSICEAAPENLLEAARIVAGALARKRKISLDSSCEKRLYPCAKETITP